VSFSFDEETHGVLPSPGWGERTSLPACSLNQFADIGRSGVWRILGSQMGFS